MKDIERFSEGYRNMRARDGDSITGTNRIKCVPSSLALQILPTLFLWLVPSLNVFFDILARRGLMMPPSSFSMSHAKLIISGHHVLPTITSVF